MINKRYISYKNITFCCKECGNQISTSCALQGQGRCRKCYLLLTIIKNPMLFCIDCKKPLNKKADYYKTLRCRSCVAKERLKLSKNNPNWKNGKSITKYFCKRCNKRICYSTAVFGTHYCKPCSLLFQKGKNHPNYIDGRKFKKRFCKECGKQLKSYTAKKCNSCSKKGLFIGKKSARYIPGLIRLYPLKFKRIRPQIRKRDNFTCQYCGMTEKEHNKKFQMNLHVHHIDFNKNNCKEKNLISLCLICNNKANGNKKFDRDYWFAYYSYLNNIGSIIFVKSEFSIPRGKLH